MSVLQYKVELLSCLDMHLTSFSRTRVRLRCFRRGCDQPIAPVWHLYDSNLLLKLLRWQNWWSRTVMNCRCTWNMIRDNFLPMVSIRGKVLAVMFTCEFLEWLRHAQNAKSHTLDHMLQTGRRVLQMWPSWPYDSRLFTFEEGLYCSTHWCKCEEDDSS